MTRRLKIETVVRRPRGAAHVPERALDLIGQGQRPIRAVDYKLCIAVTPARWATYIRG